MALIELSFGNERTDDEADADTDSDSVEIPLDGEDEATSSSTGRRLLAAALLVALVGAVAAAAYLSVRRTGDDDAEFADIEIADETAEAGVERDEE